MICAWNDFLSILPGPIRQDVDKFGKENLQELRLRLGKPPELLFTRSRGQVGQAVTRDDLNYCVNTASRYSPWTAESVRYGYITTSGGHRIGICGQAVVQDGQVRTIRSVTSLCIRVARDFPGIAALLADIKGSVLIIGSPGSGKTTLLRDLVRQLGNRRLGSIAVVDERGELFPPGAGFDSGNSIDILTGCHKAEGIDMVLRCMGPSAVAVDEITAEKDADALMRAGRCGVDLLATAHAANMEDLRQRPIYRMVCDYALFDWLVILRTDKTWSVERMMK